MGKEGTGGWRIRLPGALNWLLPAMLAALLLLYVLGMADDKAPQEIRTDTETRLCAVLGAVKGAGSVSVMVNEEGGEVVGVLVVASGADDLGVKLTLYQAVSTLLNIEAEKIEVVSMKEGYGK